MLFIGLDWARDKHDFLAMDAQGSVLTKGIVAHDAQALDDLANAIATIEPDSATVHVGVELHDGALLAWLLDQNYTVYAINPKSAERARDRHRPSGAKDDQLDAYVLADMARTDRQRLRAVRRQSTPTRELRAWVRLRARLVREKTAACQRLRGLLAEWTPRLSDLCNDFNRCWQRDLLAMTPLHEHLRRLHGNRLNAFIRVHRLREQTASKLRQVRCCPAIAIPPGLQNPLAAEIRGLVESIDALVAKISEAETAIDECIAKHPDAEIFQSLPVKGTATVGTLLAAFGESREETPHWRELAARWGAAPVTVQSGKSRHVKRRRACDHVINQALLFFSFKTAFTEGCWAKAFYQRKRAEGVDHYGTLRRLAQRWIKILYRLWQDRILYREEVHQRNRKLHGALAA
jgi:transposase